MIFLKHQKNFFKTFFSLVFLSFLILLYQNCGGAFQVSDQIKSDVEKGSTDNINPPRAPYCVAKSQVVSDCSDEIPNSKDATRIKICNDAGSEYVFGNFCELKSCVSGYNVTGSNCVAVVVDPPPICIAGELDTKSCVNEVNFAELATKSRNCNTSEQSYTAYGACIITACDSLHKLENNVCVDIAVDPPEPICVAGVADTESCTGDNLALSATRSRTCNSDGQSYMYGELCTIHTCISGYDLLNNVCIPDGSSTEPVLAFPSAEGFGAQSVGGRGGQDIKVTNLNDAGAGSLREALYTKGPRIVIFAVSGIINLVDEIRVTEPYVTIAGESSPDGVLVTGRRVILQTHNLTMRHMRFRVGSHRIKDGVDAESLDALDLYGSASGHSPGTQNVIIDHCSVSWGVDESFTASYAATDFTVQWSIISEGLSNAGHPKGEHSKGFLISGKEADKDIRASFHHNYLAHNTSRNPEIGNPANGFSVLADVRNNVIYNWYHALTGKTNGLADVNWIENFSKKGPDSYDTFPLRSDEDSTPTPHLYVYRNLGPRDDGTNPSLWNVGTGYKTDILASINWQALVPHIVAPVFTSPTSEIYASQMLESVGAIKPKRDSVDARIVNDFEEGTGSIRGDVIFPKDFPNFDTTLKAPTDNDNDGMSDAWETANGLDIKIDDSMLDKDCDGYTNIEDYLHELAGDVQIVGSCF